MKLLFTIAFALATLASVDAPAQPAPQPHPRVAVSPFVYLPESIPVPPAAARDAVVRGIEAWTGGSADFALESTTSLRAKVRAAPRYDEVIQFIDAQKFEGIDKFRELDTEGASARLKQAREQYFRNGHHFVDPNNVSEALLYEALALLDSTPDSPSRPLDLMKEMVLLDPSQTITAGSFPSDVVSFYDSARTELERDVREGGPGEGVPRQIAELLAEGEESGAAYVLVGNVLPARAGNVEVVVWLYDVEAAQFQVSTSMTISSPTGPRLEDAANRLTSQLLSCLVNPTEAAAQPLPPSSGRSPFALVVNFAYGSYLKFPSVGDEIVEPIGNVGSSIGGAYFVTREFALVAAFQFLTSMSEFSGLVEPGFRTIRMFLGGEIGLSFGPMRFALGTLMEGTAVSSITTCPGDEVQERRFCTGPRELPGRFLLGVNARPRVSYSLLKSLDVFVGGATSFYLFPLGADSLNFLTNAEAGLQYRF